MAKRPSIIDKLEMAPAEPTPEGSKETPLAKPSTKTDVVKTSVYLPRAAHERLREIAYVKRCRIHDLIMQGVDRVIAEHGHTEKASRR